MRSAALPWRLSQGLIGGTLSTAACLVVNEHSALAAHVSRSLAVGLNTFRNRRVLELACVDPVGHVSRLARSEPSHCIASHCVVLFSHT